MNLFLRTAVAILVVAAVGGGCVTRRMTVRSNVPGAQVYVDNYEIGRTPASTDFVYYGKRNIRLVKDGFETLTVEQPIGPPWYQWPGLDFFFENLWPLEIRDERQFAFEMKPQYVVPTEALLGRAEELRTATMQPSATPAVVAPAPAFTPAAGAPVSPFATSPPSTPPAAVGPYGQPTFIQPGTPAPAAGLPGYPTQPSPYAVPGTVQPTPGTLPGSSIPPSPYGNPAAPSSGYGGTPVPQLP